MNSIILSFFVISPINFIKFAYYATRLYESSGLYFSRIVILSGGANL